MNKCAFCPRSAYFTWQEIWYWDCDQRQIMPQTVLAVSYSTGPTLWSARTRASFSYSLIAASHPAATFTIVGKLSAPKNSQLTNSWLLISFFFL